MTTSLLNTLGGTAGFGETSLVRGDDNSSSKIDVSGVFGASGLNFFGNSYTGLYVNNNGSLTFATASSSFTPTAITGVTSNPLIAPFWYDVDTRPTTVLTPTPGGTSSGSNLVWYDLDATNKTFTATWDDTGYFSNKTDKLNAFQVSLVQTSMTGDFDIIMRYEALNQAVNTVGGGVARAGFSAGNGVNYYEFSESGTASSMLGLTGTSNVGVAGTYEFSVRSGSAVADVINGDSGADVIDGGGGADRINGSGGDDILLGGGGVDWVGGGNGNDRLDGGTEVDRLDGGQGDDVLFGGASNDIYIGGTGVDTFIVSAGTDWIADLGLNDEQDIVQISGAASVIATAAGNWVATAATTNNSTAVRPGYIWSKGFDIDLTAAGGTKGWTVSNEGIADAVTLTGSAFADTLQGGDGADTLYGGKGADTLYGGKGADTLYGGIGADTMNGGEGDDTFYVDDAGDLAVDIANGGVDTVFASANHTLSVSVEMLQLTGLSFLSGTGNAGANTITASDAGGNLSGLGGNDTLVGGAGADTLKGGAGADTLTGNGGADTFAFDGPAGALDVITDFASGVDHMDLSAAGFGLTAGMDLAAEGRFVLGTPTTGLGQFCYNAGNGVLAWDSNGAGAGGRSVLATLTGAPTLLASDLHMV